jgi:HAMP domain-containing protein
MRQGMRKTRAIVIIALAIVAGIVLAYSPLLLDQTQAIPLTSDRDTPGFEYGASILNSVQNTNRSPAENVKAMVTGVASLAGGLVAAIAIGLAVAAACYLIMKRRVVDRDMLKACDP